MAATVAFADREEQSAADSRVALDHGPLREPEPSAAPANEAIPSGPGIAVAAPVSIEWPADLQQVESDPGKASSAEQEMERQAAAPRPKRARQVLPQEDEGPLVQVETDDTDTAAGAADQKTPVA